ncbi:LOW QUALITY PROTEIN: targeting protein for Xklp2 [Menidia menidia]
MAEGDSDRYEFDAPTDVDFKELVESQIDDRWFEQGGGTDGHLITPSRHAPLPPREEPPREEPPREEPPREEPGPPPPAQSSSIPDAPLEKEADSPGPDSSPPPNIVTSWGPKGQEPAQPRRRTAPGPPQPRRVSKRKTISRPVAPPTKKLKETPVAQRARSGQLQAGSELRRSQRLGSRENPKSSTNQEALSSEDLEMERIRRLQQEVALHRRQNEASYRAALAGNPPPKKMQLSMTVPQEFHFSTDQRVKAPAGSSQKELDFPQQLRRASPPSKTRRGATVPKPFHLSKGSRRREEEEAGPYVPMAQQVQQFQRRTPARYHKTSRRTQERGPSPVKGGNLKLTQPHSPRLRTRQRTRPARAKSSAELEEEEVEQLHRFKIKALELNRKILAGPEDLRRPAVREPTVPEGFRLEVERRLQERQAARPPEGDGDQAPAFRANPLPRRLLEGVVGLPEKKVPFPTVPESPAFALKKRARVERRVEEVKPPSPVRAPPAPHFGLPFVPRLPQKPQLEPCPFSFEQRERERRALREKRLEEQRREEVPQFKAQLLPDFEAVVLPEKKKLEPTRPEPFRLLVDQRGAAKSSRWEQMVKEEQKQQEEAAAFKARPNTVTHKEPFRPKKETRGAVAPPSAAAEAFQLATERRAREWSEYERQAAEKEALRAKMEAQQRREEEERERQEVARLRQEQVHKAQPVRHYKPVSVKKSEVPLTVPESPNFSDRFRL